MLNAQAPQDHAKSLKEFVLVALVLLLICQMALVVVEVLQEFALTANARTKMNALAWFVVMRVTPFVVSLAVLFAFKVLVVFLALVLMAIHAALAWCAKVALVLLLLALHALHAILLLTLLPLHLDEFQVSL